MGLLGFFKKNKSSDYSSDSDSLGLNDDPFKSDPMMDPNSGLNLPKDDSAQNQQQNPYLQDQNQNSNPNPNPFANNNSEQHQNPFQKYSGQDSFQNYNNDNNPNQQQFQQSNDQKDLQIIIAKLDALRAEVQALNHRLDNLEQKQQKRMW